MIDKNQANERALWAAENDENLNTYLTEEKEHILRLASKILQKRITESDDEYSIALMAVSEAVGRYNRTRGDFWSYAAFVIKSRETDYYRQNNIEEEMILSPDMFEGEMGDDVYNNAKIKEISEKSAYTVDYSLKDEIESVGEELKEFGISFFDLAECSPKSQKTKNACQLVLKAIFTPPPLIEEIKRTKSLPIKTIISREKISSKILDRHRKYLITASLILDGDYPLIAEYLPYSK